MGLAVVECVAVLTTTACVLLGWPLEAQIFDRTHVFLVLVCFNSR